MLVCQEIECPHHFSFFFAPRTQPSYHQGNGQFHHQRTGQLAQVSQHKSGAELGREMNNFLALMFISDAGMISGR